MFVCVKETGVWSRISSQKEIVSEPRTGGKEGNVRSLSSRPEHFILLSGVVFDEAMVTFYQEVAEAEALSAEGTAHVL